MTDVTRLDVWLSREWAFGAKTPFVCGKSLFFIISTVAAFVSICSGCSVPPKPVAIQLQPADQTVALLQQATFKVQSTGTAPSFQWKRNGQDIPGATASSYNTPKTSMADSGAKFSVAITNAANSVVSNAATLIVGKGIDVPTYHYENMRLGQNLQEKTLTIAAVNTANFGKVGTFSVDGLVDAQPLYLSDVVIPNLGHRNVLYVATEHGTLYAFDADSTGRDESSALWTATTLLPGETPSDARGCDVVVPEIGITATPVIDRSQNAIYVVAMSQDGAGNFFQRIHALNLTTGKELFGGPTTITATYPGVGANSVNGNVVFDPGTYFERAALIELNGQIYTTWASHCDLGSYTSWIIAYDSKTLQQSDVFNLVPNGERGGIWMSAAGPAADAAGNMYLIVGNGDFDTNLTSNGFPISGNCGNCFVKLSTSPLTLADYFTPSNTVTESNSDFDFGSGGPMVLPDLTDADGATKHLVMGAGKDVRVYSLDRDDMGKFSPTVDSVNQVLPSALAGFVFSAPAYLNGTVYYASVGDAMKAFPIDKAIVASSPSSVGANRFPYPGATPTISADGSKNGIVWAVQNTTTAALYAYDAANLTNVLYTSLQNFDGRDSFAGNKFITPVVANGKVYIGTPNGVVVFGILP